MHPHGPLITGSAHALLVREHVHVLGGLAWSLGLPELHFLLRNPDTPGDGIKEGVEMTLALPAEPQFLESEADEKWKRSFR